LPSEISIKIYISNVFWSENILFSCEPGYHIGKRGKFFLISCVIRFIKYLHRFHLLEDICIFDDNHDNKGYSNVVPAFEQQFPELFSSNYFRRLQISTRSELINGAYREYARQSQINFNSLCYCKEQRPIGERG
jgi:hypothetical protein